MTALGHLLVASLVLAPVGAEAPANCVPRGFPGSGRAVPAFGLAARYLVHAVGVGADRWAPLARGQRAVELDAERLRLAADQDGPQEASQPPALELEALRAQAADIAAEMTELAGAAEVPELSVRIVPRPTLEAHARLEVDRALAPDRRALDEEVAKALGMLPEDADLGELYWRLLADDVGGVRDSVQEEILVADDVTPNLARLVLAHEYSQHLCTSQQLNTGLDDAVRSAGPTTDARLAVTAVREARGMLLVAAWVRRHFGADEVQALVAEESRRSRATEPLPPFVWKPILGLYSQGQAFLARQARIGPLGATPRSEDVARALAAPPRTTEELLHPARYWDPEQREEDTTPSFTFGPLPDGWEVAHEDTLGELVLALFTTPPNQRRGLSSSPLGIAQTRFTNAAAEGWDGDRVVFARREGARFVRLATRWEDDAEAAEFADAARGISRALTLDLEVSLDGSFVIVTMCDGAQRFERALLEAALSPSFG